MNRNIPAGARESFSVSGEIIHGKHLGRRLGYPTANLPRPDGDDLPPNGVHVATLTVYTGPFAGQTFPCVLNQGSQPTAPSGTATVEAYIPGFSGDLYGAQVRVDYLQFTRPEQKFASLDALKAQMARDTRDALDYFRAHPLKKSVD